MFMCGSKNDLEGDESTGRIQQILGLGKQMVGA